MIKHQTKIIMKSSCFLLAILFLLLGNFIDAKESPFNVGDKLIYELKLRGINAGTQIDEVIAEETENKQLTYHFYSQIKTNKIVSVFYKRFEKIDCWARQKDLLPVRVIKNIYLKKDKKHYDLQFNHQNHQTIIISKKNEEKNEEETINLPAYLNTFDPVSLIYYLRNQELRIGDTYQVGILSISNPEKVTIQVVSQEKINCPYGKFDTIRVKQYPNGVIVWFTKDSRHLPVKIQVNTKVCPLTAELVKIVYR